MPITEVHFMQKNDDGQKFDVEISGDAFAYLLYNIEDFGSLYRYLRGHGKWTPLDD